MAVSKEYVAKVNASFGKNLKDEDLPVNQVIKERRAAANTDFTYATDTPELDSAKYSAAKKAEQNKQSAIDAMSDVLVPATTKTVKVPEKAVSQNEKDYNEIIGKSSYTGDPEDIAKAEWKRAGVQDAEGYRKVATTLGDNLLSGAVDAVRNTINKVGYDSQIIDSHSYANSELAKLNSGDPEAWKEANRLYDEWMNANPGKSISKTSLFYDTKQAEWEKEHPTTLTDIANFGKKYSTETQEATSKLNTEMQKDASMYKTFGNMTPYLATAALGNVAGAATGIKAIATAGRVLSSSQLYLSAAGQATEEALKNGVSADKAIDYGNAVGAIELATEAMFNGLGKAAGGVVGNVGLVDSVFESARKYLGDNVYTGAKYLIDTFGEGLEEKLAEWGEYAAARLIDEGIDPRTIAEVKSDSSESFKAGMVMSLFLGASALMQNGATPQQAIEQSVEQFVQENQRTIDDLTDRSYSQRATQILNNETLYAEYVAKHGEPTGSKTEKAKQIANTLYDVDYKANKKNDRWYKPSEGTVEHTVVQTPQKRFTKAQSRVIQIINEGRPSGANEIRRTPELRKAYEELTGKTIEGTSKHQTEKILNTDVSNVTVPNTNNVSWYSPLVDTIAPTNTQTVTPASPINETQTSANPVADTLTNTTRGVSNGMPYTITPNPDGKTYVVTVTTPDGKTESRTTFNPMDEIEDMTFTDEVQEDAYEDVDVSVYDKAKSVEVERASKKDMVDSFPYTYHGEVAGKKVDFHRSRDRKTYTAVLDDNGKTVTVSSYSYEDVVGKAFDYIISHDLHDQYEVTKESKLYKGDATVQTDNANRATNNVATSNEMQQSDIYGRSVGAATPAVGEQVPTQNKTVTQSNWMDPETQMRYAPGTHEQISEKMSMARANSRFAIDSNGNILNAADVADDLLNIGYASWTGEMLDAAYIAEIEAVRNGDVARADALAEAIEKNGTKTGEALQARKKWINKTGDSLIIDAMKSLANSGLQKAEKANIITQVKALAESYDNLNKGDFVSVRDIIKQVNDIRKTGSIIGGYFNKVLDKRPTTDTEFNFEKELAYKMISEIANDQSHIPFVEKITSYHRLAMLCSPSTWTRNVGGNSEFGIINIIDTNTTRNILDSFMSKFTGQKAIPTRGGILTSKTYRDGFADAAGRAFLEICADVAPGTNSQYAGKSSRAFKMRGNVFERFMSRFSQIVSYGVSLEDQAVRGGKEAAIEESLKKKNPNGDEAQIRKEAQETADYELFVNESAAAKASSTIVKGLNTLTKPITGTTDVGIGTAVAPFVTVPTNLAVKTAEMSPFSAVVGLGQMAKVIIDAKSGKTVPMKLQRQASSNIGKGVTGAGMIAAFALLANAGCIKSSDDDDYDVQEALKARGLDGTAWNLSSFLRLLSGDSSEWDYENDYIIDIDWMEPINAFMTIGFLMNDTFNELRDTDADAWDFAKALAMDYWTGTITAIKEMPLFSATSDMFTAINQAEKGKLPSGVKSFMKSYVSSYIPNIISKISNTVDPVYRDTRGDTYIEELTNTVINKTPFKSTLPAKKDVFGNDKVDTNNGIMRFFNNVVLPGRISKLKPNEIVDELETVRAETGEDGFYPDRKAPTTVSFNNKTYDMTKEQQDQWYETYQNFYAEIVGTFMDGEMYDYIDYDDRNYILSSIEDFAKSVAKQEFLSSQGIESDVSPNWIVDALQNGNLEDYAISKLVYNQIDNDDTIEGSFEKQAVFKNWAETMFPDNAEQISNDMVFYSHIAANTDTYDKLKASGLSGDAALNVYRSVSALEDDPSNPDRYRAVMATLNSTSDIDKAMGVYMTEARYKHYNSARSEGYSPSQIVDYLDAVTGKTKKADIINAAMDIGMDKSTATYFYRLFGGKIYGK